MMSLVFFFCRTVCLTTCSSNNLGPLKHAVTLPTSLFMFHLVSFTRHYIVHFLSNFLQPTLYCSCFILFSSVCSPSHSFRLTKSISFTFTLFGYTHITLAFNLIVSFIFQPILSLEMKHLRVSMDKSLILDRYSLFEAELRWFYYFLSLYVKQEIQHI